MTDLISYEFLLIVRQEAEAHMFNLQAAAKRKTAVSAGTWSRSSDPYFSQYQHWATEEYSDSL